MERNDKKEKRKRKTQTYLEQYNWVGRQQFEFTDIQIQGKRIASNVKDQKTLLTNLTATYFVDRCFVVVILNRTVHPKMKLVI